MVNPFFGCAAIVGKFHGNKREPEMSAELISMEEWQKAKFVDWANRFAVAMILQLSERDRKRVLKIMQRELSLKNNARKK